MPRELLPGIEYSFEKFDRILNVALNLICNVDLNLSVNGGSNVTTNVGLDVTTHVDLNMTMCENGTFENFEGTEEARKNMVFRKFGGVRTFGISMLSGKTGHSASMFPDICPDDKRPSRFKTCTS